MIQLNVGIEKVDTHEGRFKLQKLERPVVVKNINGTNNSAGAITHQLEVNVYYKNHVERMRIDICNLERMKVILEMP